MMTVLKLPLLPFKLLALPARLAWAALKLVGAGIRLALVPARVGWALARAFLRRLF